MNFLVVDDDTLIREGTVRRLKNMNRPEIEKIDQAASAEEALRIFQERRIDAMLTDIRMDDMDGLTLIEKAYAYNPNLLALIVTAYDSFSYAQRAIPLGVVDFLLKPCSDEEMRIRVIKMIQRFRETDQRRSMISHDSATSSIDSVSDANKNNTKMSDEPNEKNLESRRVLSAKKYIREHLCEEINMAVVANHLDLSYTYFSRIFRNETGQSFTQYLVSQRLEEACRRMKKGEHLVDIAYQLGYKNANNLTRSFTREFGISPSKWLSEQEKKNKGGNTSDR